ncbi:HET domain-containing protein [Microdochium nivale]|nr:HET domain-containing protein [Microdochium nivale]
MATLTDDSYGYDAIDEAFGTIRLFYTTRNDNDLIECNFLFCQLTPQRVRQTAASQGDFQEEQERWTCELPYYAISYTWGGGDRSETILLDGSPFKVTRNLLDILEDICAKQPDSLFWADAISIDQGNHAEKSHQVQQMPHIYQAAEQVFIHLGRLEPNTRQDHLWRAVKEFDICTRGESWSYGNPLWTGAWEASILRSRAGSSLNSANLFNAMVDLYSHPWFTRVWIIQEVAKARSAVIFCGPYRTSSRTFALLPLVTSTRAPWHTQAILDVMPGPSRRSSWWGQDRSLPVLLDRFRGARATFQVDRIYALLGICSDTNTIAQLVPDYGCSEADVVQSMLAHLCGFSRETLGVPRLNLENILPTYGEPTSRTPKPRHNDMREAPPGSLHQRGSSRLLPNSVLDTPNAAARSLEMARQVIQYHRGRYRLLPNYKASWKNEVPQIDVESILDNWESYECVQISRASSTRELLLGSESKLLDTEEVGALLWSRWPVKSRYFHDRSLGMTARMNQALQTKPNAVARECADECCFDILQIAFRERLRSSIFFDPTTLPDGPLTLILRHAKEADPVVQLLRELGLLHIVPSSARLVDALWHNKGCGLHILTKIITNIVASHRDTNPPNARGRVFTDSEIINIWRRFGPLPELRWMWSSVAGGPRKPIILTASSLRLLMLERAQPSDVIEKLFNVDSGLPETIFSRLALLHLVHHCGEPELEIFCSTATRTADLIRMLAPSVMSRRRNGIGRKIGKLLLEVELGLHGEGSVPATYTGERTGLQLFAESIRLSEFSPKGVTHAERLRGMTPLSRAAAEGHAGEVNRLLREGSALNKVDGYGLTPLIWAVWLHNENVVDVLLGAGANPLCPGGVFHIFASEWTSSTGIKEKLNTRIKKPGSESRDWVPQESSLPHQGRQETNGRYIQIYRDWVLRNWPPVSLNGSDLDME